MQYTEFQKQVIFAAGKRLQTGRLINAIENHPQRNDFLCECTFAFSCDAYGVGDEWDELRDAFMDHYDGEHATLFPGNAFRCRPYRVDKKMRHEFIKEQYEVYRKLCGGKTSYPEAIRFINTYFETGYSEATMLDILSNKK